MKTLGITTGHRQGAEHITHMPFKKTEARKCEVTEFMTRCQAFIVKVKVPYSWQHWDREVASGLYQIKIALIVSSYGLWRSERRGYPKLIYRIWCVTPGMLKDQVEKRVLHPGSSVFASCPLMSYIAIKVMERTLGSNHNDNINN